MLGVRVNSPNRSPRDLVYPYWWPKTTMFVSKEPHECLSSVAWECLESIPEFSQSDKQYTRAKLCDDKITTIPSRPRESPIGITEQPRLLSRCQNIKTPPPCSIRLPYLS